MLSQTMVALKSSRQQADRVAPPSVFDSLGSTIEMMGTTMSFARNSEIYFESEPADYLYKVVSGVVRTCKVLADGRRQIGSFYLPGNIFGFEGNEHTFSAEAVVDCKVLLIKRSTLFVSRDPSIASQLWGMAATELQRAQAHLVLLMKGAQQRVVDFLMEMSTRSSSSSANVVDLSMSRQDIADYLGMTIETVSRMLSQLENCGVIAMPSARRIVLRSLGTLHRLSA